MLGDVGQTKKDALAHRGVLSPKDVVAWVGVKRLSSKREGRAGSVRRSLQAHARVSLRLRSRRKDGKIDPSRITKRSVPVRYQPSFAQVREHPIDDRGRLRDDPVVGVLDVGGEFGCINGGSDQDARPCHIAKTNVSAEADTTSEPTISVDNPAIYDLGSLISVKVPLGRTPTFGLH